MKKLIVALIMAGYAFSATADINVQANAAVEVSPSPIAGVLPVWQPQKATRIMFDVFRDGKPFGAHTISFEPLADGGFIATSDVNLTVKIGPITAYKYSHDSLETWKDGRLLSVEAETRKEGKNLVARAVLDETGLKVDGTNFSGAFPETIIPASHWNIAQLYSDKMLSTEGGQPLDVVVENLGRKTLMINGQSVETTKFKLTSDLTVFLWYTDDGRWVKLNFTARGQLIDYQLKDMY